MGIFTPKLPPSEMNFLADIIQKSKDSAEIVNTTTNAKVFFCRLNFIFDLLLLLKQYEKYKIFKGSTPTQDFMELQKSLNTTVNTFIDCAFSNEDTKIASVKTEKARFTKRVEFTSDMLFAFENANSFWEGNILIQSGKTLPHYTDQLFLDENLDYLKSRIEDYTEINSNFIASKAVSNEPRYSNVISTNIQFNLSRERFYRQANEYDMYYMSKNDTDILAAYMDAVNNSMHECVTLCDEFPYKPVGCENLKFEETSEFLTDFTVLLYCPLTSTGKAAKYPFRINFFTRESFNGSDDLFGKIHIVSNGTIGKMEIVRWYGGKCFIVNCGIKDKRFMVIRIDENVDGVKVCRYNYNKKITPL